MLPDSVKRGVFSHARHRCRSRASNPASKKHTATYHSTSSTKILDFVEGDELHSQIHGAADMEV